MVENNNGWRQLEMAQMGLWSLGRLHGTHFQHTWKIKICLLLSSDLNSKLTFLAPKSLNMFSTFNFRSAWGNNRASWSNTLHWTWTDSTEWWLNVSSGNWKRISWISSYRGLIYAEEAKTQREPISAKTSSQHNITRLYTADAVWYRHPSGQPTWQDVTGRDMIKPWHDVTLMAACHDMTWHLPSKTKCHLEPLSSPKTCNEYIATEWSLLPCSAPSASQSVIHIFTNYFITILYYNSGNCKITESSRALTIQTSLPMGWNFW